MKKLILIAIFAVSFICTQAQETPKVQNVVNGEERTALRTTWVSSNPGDNWFISINAGIADLMSEEGRYVGFSKRIKPTLGLSVGKWLSPVWGLRMNVTGANLQGFATWNYAGDTGIGSWYTGNNYANPYGVSSTNSYAHAWDKKGGEYIRKNFLGDKRSSSKGDGYEYELQYIGTSIDMLLNLRNMFKVYDEDALFNPIIYGGLGYTHTFKDGERTAVNSIMEKFGVLFDFRLNDSWNLGLDVQSMIVPEVFDRRVGDGNSQDILMNYTLGVTYKFSDREFYKAQLHNPTEIAALNDQINNLRAENAQLALRPVFCPECPKAVVVAPTPTKQEVKFLPTPVFFKINSTVIQNDQWQSIEKAAAYLNANPNAKIKVMGYADRKTGTPAGNKKLSEGRAKVVYDALIGKYKISPNRIEKGSFGDSVQPFTENDWNRVVVFVI